MNYEYPLNRNRLRIEQEELLLKLALFHYLERENDRLRAGMQEQPDPPEDRESAEHAVAPCHAAAALAGLRAKGLAGLRAGGYPGGCGVPYLFHLFKHRFCGIPVG